MNKLMKTFALAAVLGISSLAYASAETTAPAKKKVKKDTEPEVQASLNGDINFNKEDLVCASKEGDTKGVNILIKRMMQDPGFVPYSHYFRRHPDDKDDERRELARKRSERKRSEKSKAWFEKAKNTQSTQ